jgi:2-dehydro-3-deoxyphosphogluconate aldolase/(4S)-4-hydroxy-2-oxoglutarate aldolase
MAQKDSIDQTMAEVIADGAILAVRLGSRDSVVQVCRAAIRGGLRVLELTLTTPGASGCHRGTGAEKDVIVGSRHCPRAE